MGNYLALDVGEASQVFWLLGYLVVVQDDNAGWRPESGVKSDGRGSGFMVMLGGGTDILSGVTGLPGGDGAWL